MALTLPNHMREHYGKNIFTMPQILEANQVPMPVFGLMQDRIEHGDEFPDLWNSYFDTSDLPVYPQSDKFGTDQIYTLLTVNNQRQTTEEGKKALKLMTRKRLLTGNYGVKVPDELFEEWRDAGEKIGFIKIPRSSATEKHLTEEQISDNLNWRVLSRHPDEVAEQFAITQKYFLNQQEVNLLRKYANDVATRTEQQENMALFSGNPLKNKTTLKAWCVVGLEVRSFADGRYDLDSGLGRFVGYLAPEAQVSEDSSQQSRFYTIDELLQETGRTDDFAPNQRALLQDILGKGGYQIRKE